MWCTLLNRFWRLRQEFRFWMTETEKWRLNWQLSNRCVVSHWPGIVSWGQSRQTWDFGQNNLVAAPETCNLSNNDKSKHMGKYKNINTFICIKVVVSLENIWEIYAADVNDILTTTVSGWRTVCLRYVRNIICGRILGFAINTQHSGKHTNRTIDITPFGGGATQWHAPHVATRNASNVCDLWVDIEFNWLADNNQPKCRADSREMWREGMSDWKGWQGSCYHWSTFVFQPNSISSGSKW